MNSGKRAWGTSTPVKLQGSMIRNRDAENPGGTNKSGVGESSSLLNTFKRGKYKRWLKKNMTKARESRGCRLKATCKSIGVSPGKRLRAEYGQKRERKIRWKRGVKQKKMRRGGVGVTHVINAGGGVKKSTEPVREG